MKNANDVIIKVLANFMVPVIILFAVYVQMHGEITPGGGFQAGVILASGVILYVLAFGDAKFLQVINLQFLRVLSAMGVMIYALTGIVPMLRGGAFLDHSKIFEKNNVFSQEFGVFAVELGVGVTVFSVMLVLYFAFSALLD